MSEAAVTAAPVGIFGGTFNPVHFGHLRSALEAREQLQLSALHLLPSSVPPHREAPHCSAEHRANMVSLAIEGQPGLVCDRREMARPGRSFSYDTLVELRHELGPHRSICLIVGADAVSAMDTWHRWRELLDCAHLVVMGRPGWQLPRRGAAAQWLARHRVEDLTALHSRPAGGVLPATFRQLSISSTEIRDLISEGRSAAYLTPRVVLDYIDKHQLYSAPAARAD